MGHNRASAVHKARKKRRAALAKWKPRPKLERLIGDALEGFRVGAVAVASALQMFADACLGIGQMIAQAIQSAFMPDAGPIQPVTIAELYALAGCDGATMGRARFNAEGGYSLN